MRKPISYLPFFVIIEEVCDREPRNYDTMTCFYRMNILGTFVSFIFISIHIASDSWLEWEYDGFDTLRNSDQYNDKLYFKPWARIAPFAIGLLFGIVMYKSGGKVKMNKVMICKNSI